MEPQREQQIAQAAQALAGAVYAFLNACHHASASLNQSVQQARAAYGPLPVVLPAIPLPPLVPQAAVEQLLLTPIKEAPKSLSFPAIESPLWTPTALFQHSLLPINAAAPPIGAAAPTRSTGRVGSRRAHGHGNGHHSPPKLPPPLFDATPQQLQLQLGGHIGHASHAAAAAAAHAMTNGVSGPLAKSGSNMQQHLAGAWEPPLPLHPAALAGLQPQGLHHWKSEVSANMAATSAGAGAAGAAAGCMAGPCTSPLSSPRAAALMAVCQEEAEHTQQQQQGAGGSGGCGGGSGLVRLTSNLSSHYSGCLSAGDVAATAAAAAAAAPLAKQKSDLASLALLAEEEFQAAEAATAEAAAAEAAAEAEAAATAAAAAVAAAVAAVSGEQQQQPPALPQQQPASRAVKARHKTDRQGREEGEEEGEEEGAEEVQPAAKRQHVGSNSPQPQQQHDPPSPTPGHPTTQ